MACKITYKGIRYNSLEELYADAYKKSKSLEPTEQDLSQQQVKPFDADLAKKIQQKLQELYPEIQLNITNNPVWERGDNVFNQQEFNNEINFRLKATKVILDNYNKIKQWESNKSINQETLYKKIGELGVPRQQLELLKESEGNTVKEKLTNFVANYSYAIEINTAKEGTDFYGAEDFRIGNTRYYTVTGEKFYKVENDFANNFNKESVEIDFKEFEKAAKQYKDTNEQPTQHYSNLTVPGGTNYTENEIATPGITPSIKGHAQFATDKGIGWFRSDEQVIGGKAVYRVPDEGRMFFEDEYNQLEKTEGGTSTKTRRILEVQSDLFQKGRDKKDLINLDKKQLLDRALANRDEIGNFTEGELIKGDTVIYNEKEYTVDASEYNYESGWIYTISREENDDFDVLFNVPFEALKLPTLKSSGEQKNNQNQFLQLLNKDNNWVTFFLKSIIQDSAKKGYEKVLFPSGNTASKIEGHTTLEEFKKQKEDRIKELEESKTKDKYSFTDEYSQTHTVKTDLEKINNEINQLKQELERVEREGFGALRPIYNFYENTVASILKKQGYNPIQVTDEYGNTWNEVNINQARDLAEVLLQRNEASQIIGQANIKAMTVLVDAINQKQDTLPHEYAHHYIAWFRNTPIVQEAIKKWGSEEALVQSIGEQVVKQRGEAYNWWNSFVKWIMNKFNSLSSLKKEELTQILTDAFLTRQNLNQQLVKPGVEELFESNPELANAVYEALGFKTNITQDNKSYYRGQLKPFKIDKNGNLILEPKYAGWQEEISDDKHKGMGISMSPDLSIANAQGNMFYEGNVDRPQDEGWMDEIDAENWITNAQYEGYYVLQVDKAYIIENFKDIFDNGNYEQRIGTTKPIIIPKGKFKIENITPDVETQITPQQKATAQQLYSQYLDQIFPNSKVKDIVYHGTGEFNAEEILKYGFDKSLQGQNKVIYFTGDKKDSFGSLGGIVSAIVNIEKLFNNRFSSLVNKDENSDSFYFPTEEDVNSRIYDSVAKRNPGNIFKDKNDNISEVSVIEPEQIHILGSKQDIEGFKQFVNQPTSKPTAINPEQFPSALQEAIDAMIMLDPTRDIQSIIDELTMDGTINQECN